MKKLIMIISMFALIGCIKTNEPQRYSLTSDQLWEYLMTGYRCGVSGVDTMDMKAIHYSVWR